MAEDRTMIVFEDGIPVPEQRRRPKAGQKYRFQDMKPGQSFFVPGDPKKKMSALSSSFRSFCKNNGLNSKGCCALRPWKQNGMDGARFWLVKTPEPVAETPKLRAVGG